jgi:glutaminyl-tRNA synthetase
MGTRTIPFSRELWIEREDFMEVPSKGFFRFSPGAKVRLRYAFIAECTGFKKNDQGAITEVHARIFEDSKSGTPTADQYKVKGNLHWVSAKHALMAPVRLYDRLFAHPNPGARREGDPEDLMRDFKDDLHPDSLQEITAALEPALAQAQPEDHFQFERHGYFVADRYDTRLGQPVFNRTVGLRDSWSQQNSPKGTP